jgi:dipeptidyl aminopeptidase/acylaminoacyl peptidase
LFVRDGKLELFDSATERFRTLTVPPAGANDVGPRWSSTGEQLAFIRVSGESRRLMLLDVDSGQLRDLGGEHPSSPNLGPDGDVLYYSNEVLSDEGSRTEPPYRYQLIELDLGTEERTVLFETEGTGGGLSPILSPDGSKLAISTHSEDSDSSIGNQHILDLPSGVVTAVLGTDAIGRAWLPDSSGLLVAIFRLWFATQDADPAVLWDTSADVLTVVHSPVDDRIALRTHESLWMDGVQRQTRCTVEILENRESGPQEPIYVAPDDFCVSLRDWSPDASRLLVSRWWPELSGPSYEPPTPPPADDKHYLLDVSTGSLHQIASGNTLRPVSWRPEQ